MKGLELHLKGGTVLTVDATDVSVRRNSVTGDYEEIAWDTPDNPKRKLLSIEPNQIAAVVVIR